MRVSTPIFSENEKKNDSRYNFINIRCSIDKNIWVSFKTLISLNRLDIKDVLSKIIKEWIIDFGKHYCDNCRELVDDNNCIIIISDGVWCRYCDKCYLK